MRSTAAASYADLALLLLLLLPAAATQPLMGCRTWSSYELPPSEAAYLSIAMML
jgi:hypothetical protein